MPKGVYPHKKLAERTPEVQAKIKRCLDKGRTDKAVREKAIASLRLNGADPSFRERMSSTMIDILKDPVLRKRRSLSLLRYTKTHGALFKGGNGQPPTKIVKSIELVLKPFGFVRELAIKTKGHGTSYNAPSNYKVDFGNVSKKIAVEVDGPIHQRKSKKEKDLKKTKVLEALGWKVERIIHD